MEKKRPIGVTLLAILAGFAAAVAIIYTLQMLHLWPVTGLRRNSMGHHGRNLALGCPHAVGRGYPGLALRRRHGDVEYHPRSVLSHRGDSLGGNLGCTLPERAHPDLRLAAGNESSLRHRGDAGISFYSPQLDDAKSSVARASVRLINSLP